MQPPKGYEYISTVGKGQALTWIAKSQTDGHEYIIKTLELKNVEDWKGIELFEREVNTLKQLRHDAIPKFVDFISDEYKGASRWHIVQAIVNGLTIQEYAKNNPITESFLQDFTTQVLLVLQHLQSFSPPLFHRDIKPENLMIENGKIILIDFGSVRHVVPSEAGGWTIVGTSGFMAPEQLMGRADASSDLYALGMTLIFLITQTHPNALQKENTRIVWETQKRMKLDDEFIQFVNKLTEPFPSKRFKNATEALKGMNSTPVPTALIPAPVSTTFTIKEPDNATIIARNWGLVLSDEDKIAWPLLVLAVNVFLLFTLPFIIWFAHKKMTRTRFQFQDGTVNIQKGWVFPKKFTVDMSALLEFEPQGVHKAPLKIEGMEVTGPLGFRERAELQERLQEKALRHFETSNTSLHFEEMDGKKSNDIELVNETEIVRSTHESRK